MRGFVFVFFSLIEKRNMFTKQKRAVERESLRAQVKGWVIDTVRLQSTGELALEWEEGQLSRVMGAKKRKRISNKCSTLNTA